jgi:RimJ/RimL family protein N-acetyltransferase
MSVIETDRLILREFNKNDYDFIYRLLNTPGWLRFIGSRGITGHKEAKMYLSELVLPGYTKNGFGFYMVVRKQDGVEMGMCGLVKREGLEDVDIGFAILPEFERKGYTTEAALATMNYADNELRLPKVAAITTKDNTACINVLKKLDMKFEKFVKLPNDPEELMLFARVF